MDGDRPNGRGDKSMTCVLVEAIMNLATFVEFSDDDTVDPDDAVQQLEDLGVILDQLTQTERAEFVQCLERLAADRVALNEQAAPFVIPGTERYVTFLKEFPVNFGWVDDEDDE
jgi:hypothetical protein